MKPLFALLISFAAASVSAQVWENAALSNQIQRDMGFSGGEGGQWPQALAIDGTDGKVLLFGSDVGGLWRSTNGGALWEPANHGYTPRGSCGLFIDPKNPARAISVASNSSKAIFNNYHGLYLTTDTARTWTQVLPDNASGYRDIREQVAFDPSSFDSIKGYCTLVYYSRISRTAPSEDGTGTLQAALYKSTNGGQSWSLVPNSAAYGHSMLKVHPGKGIVFAANNNGLFRSDDGGLSFEQTFTGQVKGFDLSPSDPAKVWLLLSNKLYISSDTGKTFSPVSSTGFTSWASYLRVSPADHRCMITQHSNPADPWNTWYLFSSNEGQSWTKTTHDRSLDFLPRNLGRMMYPSWHPADKNILYAVGGDFITRSVNGGASLSWWNNGSTAIMSAGILNFNAENPDLMFFSAQDYDASVSLNGGYTFQYLNMSGYGWGGDIHGGYTLDSLTWFGRKSEGWEDPECDIVITRDGGRNYTSQYLSGGHSSCMALPGNRNILFAGDMRSTDKGLSWTKMNGCDGVFAADTIGEYGLIGVSGNNLVVHSLDQGESWQALAAVPGRIVDLAFDGQNKLVYTACYTDGLWKVYLEDSAVVNLGIKTPADRYGTRRFSTVAVDPGKPDMIYTGGTRDIYSNDVGVLRSTDQGYTWLPLTTDPRHDNPQFGLSAGRETSMIRVHPLTGYAWCGSSCYGLWKIARPGSIPEPQPRMRLNRETLNLRKNETFRLEPRFYHSTDSLVEWKSGNTTRVTVDADGNILALGTGNALITATGKETGLTASCMVMVLEDKGPWMGTRRPIPGTIQAEHFDTGGEGYGYHDASPANEGTQYRPNEAVDIETCSEGGYNVGWTAAGEWMAYSVEVDSSMYYDLEIRVAANTDGKLEFLFDRGALSSGILDIPATGGWQVWKTITKKSLWLEKGEQEMKVRIEVPGYNLNYFKFKRGFPLGLEESGKPVMAKIYPNPFHEGILHVQPGSLEYCVLIVRDVYGREVWRKEGQKGEGFRVPREELESGIYFFILWNKRYAETVKVVVW